MSVKLSSIQELQDIEHGVDGFFCYTPNKEFFGLAIFYKLERLINGGLFVSQKVIDLVVVDLNIGASEKVSPIF